MFAVSAIDVVCNNHIHCLLVDLNLLKQLLMKSNDFFFKYSLQIYAKFIFIFLNLYLE